MFDSREYASNRRAPENSHQAHHTAYRAGPNPGAAKGSLKIVPAGSQFAPEPSAGFVATPVQTSSPATRARPLRGQGCEIVKNRNRCDRFLLVKTRGRVPDWYAGRRGGPVQARLRLYCPGAALKPLDGCCVGRIARLGCGAGSGHAVDRGWSRLYAPAKKRRTHVLRNNRPGL